MEDGIRNNAMILVHLRKYFNMCRLHQFTGSSFFDYRYFSVLWLVFSLNHHAEIENMKVVVVVMVVCDTTFINSGWCSSYEYDDEVNDD